MAVVVGVVVGNASIDVDGLKRIMQLGRKGGSDRRRIALNCGGQGFPERRAVVELPPVEHAGLEEGWESAGSHGGSAQKGPGGIRGRSGEVDEVGSFGRRFDGLGGLDLEPDSIAIKEGGLLHRGGSDAVDGVGHAAPRLPMITTKVASRRRSNSAGPCGDTLQVIGYTDNQAIHTVVFPSNYTLSAARAQAAASVLAETIGRGRINAEGRADADPIADNATPVGRQRNRRIEIVLHAAGAR